MKIGKNKIRNASKLTLPIKMKIKENQYDLPTHLGPWDPEDQAIGDVR